MTIKDFLSGQQEYFHLSSRRVYKERTPYDFCQFKLENYGQKFEYNDQGKRSLPEVWSNDIMSIETPHKQINKVDNKTFPQDWIAYNQAQTQEKILFMELLHELTSQIPKQKYKGTGRPSADVGEMIFSICLKTYIDFSSRRIEADVQIAKQLGYINHVPHFNTILKYLNKPELKDVFKVLIDVSAMPLRLVEDKISVDASGFSTSMFKRWFDVRTGKSSRRLFKKAHIVSGVKTNVIVSVEITDGYVHDTLLFKNIVEHAFKNFTVKEVSADKGYSSRSNLAIVSKNSAIPFIPFHKCAKGRAGGVAIWNAMYHYFKENREEFMKHYHLRSNAESVFSMIKRKQGTNLKTKNDIAQINEIMCKCLVHNICVLIQEMFELGIKVDFMEDSVQELMCRINL